MQPQAEGQHPEDSSPPAVTRGVLRSNTKQAPTQSFSVRACVAYYFICVLVVFIGRRLFGPPEFLPLHTCATVDTREAMSTIIGLSTSQHSNICFPLPVLNYVSPHLPLAYSPTHRFADTLCIRRFCVHVWFFKSGAWGGHLCRLRLHFNYLFKITALFNQP